MNIFKDKDGMKNGAAFALAFIVAYKVLMASPIVVILSPRFDEGILMGALLSFISGAFFGITQTIKVYTESETASRVFPGIGVAFALYALSGLVFADGSAVQLLFFTAITLISTFAVAQIGKKLIAFRIYYSERFDLELKK